MTPHTGQWQLLLLNHTSGPGSWGLDNAGTQPTKVMQLALEDLLPVTMMISIHLNGYLEYAGLVEITPVLWTIQNNNNLL